MEKPYNLQRLGNQCVECGSIDRVMHEVIGPFSDVEAFACSERTLAERVRDALNEAYAAGSKAQRRANAIAVKAKASRPVAK